jgi:hypothetical protein
MPRLILDPNNFLCPDYTLPIYQNAKATFMNDNTTEEQAATILTNVWKANNMVDIQQWQEQVNADAHALEDHQYEEEHQHTLEEEAATK